MESVSNHVNVFAKGLWEEAFLIPYVADLFSSQFTTQRIQARSERFIFAMHEQLVLAEVRELLSIWAALSVSQAFADIHVSILSILNAALESTNKPTTLHSVLKPLYDELALGNLDRIISSSSLSLSSGSILSPAILCGTTHNVTSLSDASYKFISHIDECLGEFIVCLTERLLRGCAGSSIWSRTSTLLWAQSHKSPWNACMLLAGADIPDALAITNLSRVPDSISKLLVRLKPKLSAGTRFGVAQTVYCARAVSAKILNPPEGYVLVEYFGSHEFGWLKTEHTAPFTHRGQMDHSSENKPLQGGSLGLDPSLGITLLAPPNHSTSAIDSAAVQEAVDVLNGQAHVHSEEYDDVLPVDEESIAASTVLPVEPVPVKPASVSAEPKPKRRSKSAKESNPPTHSPYSLTLSNKVIVPAFSAPLSSSRQDVALLRTRLFVAWANFTKPVFKRGRSPFIDESVDMLPSNQTLHFTKAVKRHRSSDAKEVKEGDARGDDASTVSISDGNYLKDIPIIPAVYYVPPSAGSSGEGLIQTRFIDTNADIFFRENRSSDSRKAILRAELARVREALQRLQTDASSRQGASNSSVMGRLPAFGYVRKITINPGRVGGVAVGNAKIGMARSYLLRGGRLGSALLAENAL